MGGSAVRKVAIEEIQAPLDVDAEADEAIALCGGDIRAALKATLVANAYLEAELDRVLAMISAGYSRRQARNHKS
jgi:hypothetical protein